MEKRLEEFKTYLFDMERSINTVDSYARSVGVYFKKYDEVNKKNMMEFIKSRYGHMLGIGDDDPVKQEYDRLLAELKEQQLSNQAQMIMMGLNPQFMR